MSSMRHDVITHPLVAMAWFTAPLQAQLTTPSHWRWVTDAPAKLVAESDVPDSAWRFVSMPPGWHVTTGPGAMLFDPAYEANGRFSLETKIFLFPNPSDEGYGLFVGGRELDDDRVSAVAFLIRRDGAASVARMAGTDVEFLVPWQPHSGTRAHEGSGTVENVLRLSAEPQRVVYLVNGDTVAVLPRSAGLVEGRFGLRVGARLNVHVSHLDYTQHLALPARAP